jgi:hypothetical protein
MQLQHQQFYTVIIIKQLYGANWYLLFCLSYEMLRYALTCK